MGRPRVKVEQGKTYNHLKAIAFSHMDENQNQIWLCECDCGNKYYVKASSLVSGHTKSCGCRQHYHTNYKHGLSDSRLFNIYYKMIERCYKPSVSTYKNYGAKEIMVCDEWRNDFIAFAVWSLQNGYSDDLSIDRIDNNKGYSPDNCRWVSMKEQQNNRTNNRWLSYNGETHTMSQWADITGISEATIYARLKLGWNIEKTLTQKVQIQKKIKKER